MDLLNDQYPLYPINPDKDSVSESDKESAGEYLENVKNINYKRMNIHRKFKETPYDIWYTHYSDDLWYFWSMCNEYTKVNMLPFFDNLGYHSFCKICYHNSITKNKKR